MLEDYKFMGQEPNSASWDAADTLDGETEYIRIDDRQIARFPSFDIYPENRDSLRAIGYLKTRFWAFPGGEHQQKPSIQGFPIQILGKR